MTTETLPDHFEGEDVIITFEKEYDSTLDSTTRTLGIQNVEGKLLSWNTGGGTQPSEDVFAFGGRTFNFSKPREKFNLSFELVINNSDFDFVHMGSAEANARIGLMSGKLVRSTDVQKRWRVGMWFQAADKHVKSGSIIAPSKTSPLYMMMFCDVKSVTFDKEFSADEFYKGTLNLEFSSSDSDGNANYFEQEGVHTGATTSGPQQLKLITTTTTAGFMNEAKGYLDWSATTTPAWFTGSTTTDVSVRYRSTSGF